MSNAPDLNRGSCSCFVLDADHGLNQSRFDKRLLREVYDGCRAATVFAIKNKGTNFSAMFNDFYVDTDGLIYVTNRIRGGLYILEYTGPAIQ